MMMLTNPYLSALVAVILVLIYVLVKRRVRHFELIGIPCVRPTVKNFFRSFLPTNLVTIPCEAYQDSRSTDYPVIGFFQALLKPTILILSPDMVKNVLIKDFSHFQDHGVEFNTDSDPLSEHLFGMKGEKWRALRVKLLPAFSSGKLKGMIPLMEAVSSMILNDIKADPSKGTDVDIKDLFRTYTIGVIASIAYGIDPESIKDPNCEFRRLASGIQSPSLTSLLSLFLIIFCPKLSKLLKLKFMPKEMDDFFVNLTKDTLKMRKESGIKRNDFIQLLLELKEKGSVNIDQIELEEDEIDKVKQAIEAQSTVKIEMTDGLLAAQAFVFMVGGYDNVSFLCAITMYMLSKHRDIQDKVRQEVREAKNRHNGLNYQSVKEMKYLDACINETMRIYPPQAMILRSCTKTYKLSNGQTIDKGTSLIIPVIELHHDERYWENPTKFYPDRFLANDYHPGTFLPFSNGPRMCIGSRLSFLIAKVMIAEAVDKCDLFLSNKTKEPLKFLTLKPEIEGGLYGTLKHFE